ncbi:MAG: hypothetical protein EA001_10785 [Oscillatoriales cyanobacterium]|nr:MAG: hypothetical protein EA001_10785 [Oscillatoriales cyanobacterium]
MPLLLALVGAVALLLFLDWALVGSLVAIVKGAIGWVWPLPVKAGAIGLGLFLVWCLSAD